MNALQVIGAILGAVALASQQLSDKMPQWAPYTSIIGTVAAALLFAMNHQAQASEPAPPKQAAPIPASSTLPSAQLPAPSGLPAQPAPAVIMAPTTAAKS